MDFPSKRYFPQKEIIVWLFIQYIFMAFSFGSGLVSLNETNGLSNNKVLSIHKDSNGFLWIGTKDGLNLYDGTNIEQFNVDVSDPHALHSGFISCIFEDSKGKLFIGTKSGLSFFDENKRHFVTIFKADSLFGRARFWINEIIEIKDFGYIIATSQGLVKIPITLNNPKKIEVISGEVFSTFKMNESIIACTGKRTWLYNWKSDLIKELEELSGIEYIIKGKSELMGVGEKLEIQFSIQNGSFEVDAVTPHDFQNINRISPSKIGYTSGGDAYVYDGNKHEKLLENYSYEFIFKQFDGIDFIGFENEGLLINHESILKYKDTSAPGLKEFKNKEIFCFQELNSENLILGTMEHGLFHLNRKSGIVRKIDISDKGPGGSYEALKLYGKNLFLGTTEGGGALNLSTEDFYPFVIQGHQGLDERFEGSVCAITGNDSLRYLATHDGKLYSITKNQLKLLFDELGPLNSMLLIGNELFFMGRRGVQVYNTRNQSLQKLHLLSNSKRNGEQVGMICATQINENHIAFGTNGGGIVFFNKETEEAEIFNRTDGLPGNKVLFLQPYKESLWIVTNKGICEMELEKRNFRQYLTNSQIEINTSYPNRGLLTSTGELFIGLVDGVIALQIADWKPTESIPELQISRMKIFNQPVYPQTSVGILEEPIYRTHEITLPHNKNYFSFFVSDVNYIGRDKANFRYMLTEYDEQWLESDDHSIAYTNVPPGEYVFKVTASYNDSEWSEEKTMNILILNPWWKRWWAVTIWSSIILILLIVWSYLLYVRIKMKRELILAKRENEKQQEISKARLNLFSNIIDEIKEPIDLIYGVSGSVGQINSGLDQVQVDKILKNEANHLSEILLELKGLKKAQMDFIPINKKYYSYTSIRSCISNDLESISYVKDCPLNFPNEDIEDLFIGVDIQWFRRAIRSLTHFVIREFSQLENINFDITKLQDGICFKFDFKGISKLFNEKYESNKNPFPSNENYDIRIEFIKKVIASVGGQLFVKKQDNTLSYHITLLDLKYEKYSTVDKDVNDFVTIDQNWKPYLDLKGEMDQVEVKKGSPAILVVSKDYKLRFILAKALSNLGYKISLFDHMKDALQVAKEKVPSVLIYDESFEKENTSSILDEIKKSSKLKYVPVIIISDTFINRSKEELLKSGVEVFLEKPFKVSLLEVWVKNLIDRQIVFLEKFKGIGNEMDENETKELSKEGRELLENFDRLISENLVDETMDLDFIAQNLAQSKSNLNRKVKFFSGLSPKQYVQRYRLQKAAQLLEEGNVLTISQLATDTGFSSPEYFAVCFKKEFGITPKGYSKKFGR